MTRISTITPDQATPQQAELFAAVKAKLGKVPNLIRGLANSTAALRGYLELSGALAAGAGLDARQRELVALAVGQANGCGYCLAAHSAIGKMVGLSPEAIAAARQADGSDPSDRAVVQFASAVVESRGRVDDEQLEAFRAAGFGDEAITEVVAHVALNVLTNYFNNLAETDVDFPAAAPLAATESPAAEGVACGCSV